MRDAPRMGTGIWFFQSTIFEQWKSTLPGSLLWIHGRRMFSYSLTVDKFSLTQRDEARSSSGSSFISYYRLRELISLFSSAIIDDIRVISEAGLASIAYFYFDFRDIHKQRLRDVISSLLFQLSHNQPIAVKYLNAST